MPKIIYNVIINNDEKKEIQQMINTGLTVEQIVDELGISIIL